MMTKCSCPHCDKDLIISGSLHKLCNDEENVEMEGDENKFLLRIIIEKQDAQGVIDRVGYRHCFDKVEKVE